MQSAAIQPFYILSVMAATRLLTELNMRRVNFTVYTRLSAFRVVWPLENFKIIVKPTESLSDFYHYQALEILNNILYNSSSKD